MAMPQRDDLIEKIKRTDALLEYAVMHGEESEAERLRAKLRSLASLGDGSLESASVSECLPIWNGTN